jgi:hypothetical protein
LADIQNALDAMAGRGEIHHFNGFYQISADPSLIARRAELNRRAEAIMPTAHRMARLIGAFPYVRAVFVSGSLSKQCLATDGDIDFFIVTAPRRMWLARTMLVVFKKLFLFNSHKYFCINYFVDAEHLEIHEKNLYTATETATLLPMFGRETCAQFQQANPWTQEFLPHFQERSTAETPEGRPGPVKRLLEHLFGGNVGEWLDVRCMRLTQAHRRRKFKHFDARRFEGAFSAGRGHSKHHPLHFQGKVMQAYLEQLTVERMDETARV